MFYPGSALERAMRIQEVLLRAISGKIHWFQAAEILGVTPRTMHRWKVHFESHGYDAFIDRRRGHPSPKRVPVGTVQQVLTLFREHYNDFTNAFKAYRREVIDGCRPFLSNHFNLTIELPLKAIVRGYSWTVVPTNWYGREAGESKFLIKEMGSRYVYIILYALIEKYFSRGDYRRTGPS